MSPTVTRITIYPIKSCDGLDVDVATCLPCGALQGDRRFAMVEATTDATDSNRQPSATRFLNAKRLDRFHQLATRFNLDDGTVSFVSKVDDRQGEFPLFGSDRKEAEQFLTDFFQVPVRFIEDVATGFPDDNESPGPTVISHATLQAVSDWFGLTVDETRRRFRANIEIDGVDAFWEDRLFGPFNSEATESTHADEGRVRFQIGTGSMAVEYHGTNPCQRCVVPTRSSETGSVTVDFAQQFRQRREETLPDWAANDRFNHFYRLAVNTIADLGEQSAEIRVGSAVKIIAD